MEQYLHETTAKALAWKNEELFFCIVYSTLYNLYSLCWLASFILGYSIERTQKNRVICFVQFFLLLILCAYTIKHFRKDFRHYINIFQEFSYFFCICFVIVVFMLQQQQQNSSLLLSNNSSQGEFMLFCESNLNVAFFYGLQCLVFCLCSSN